MEILNKKLVILASLFMASLFTAAPASAQNIEKVLVCESKGGLMQLCKAQDKYEVRLRRQLSRSQCVEGSTWGHQDDAIWVTGNCRGEFELLKANRRNDRAISEIAVKCESDNYARTYCQVDTGLGVQLTQQLSDAPCIAGRTWAYDQKGIWADRGCRGVFTIQREEQRRRSYEVADRVTCEARGPRRTYCAANTQGGLRISSRNSNENCRFNETWGTDSKRGVWVSHGCRAEFELLKAATDEIWSQNETCTSRNYERVYCKADTRGGVKISQRFGPQECRLNDTWGYDSKNGIWVELNCSASFLLADPPESRRGRRN